MTAGRTALAVGLALVAGVACAARPGTAAGTTAGTTTGTGSASPPVPPTSAIPVLLRLTPDTVDIGNGAVVTVTVQGRHLATTGNTVLLAEATIANVAAADGTTLRFAVPLTLPSGGEAAPRSLGPGTYPVRIRTAAGTSNALSLVVR